MLTPSAPTLAIANSASSAHSAEANENPTCGSLPHETVFISSIRRRSPRAWALATSAATLSASPRDARLQRMCGIVG